MNMGQLSAIFVISLGLFWAPAQAAVYRLSPVDSSSEELRRPKFPFPEKEVVYRMINLTTGAPFSSYNSEFVIAGGRLKRIKAERVNHVMQAVLDQITENLICEQRLEAGTRRDHLGPGQAWRERTVGPIDRQALEEMSARQYINGQQAQFYSDSTSWHDADRMIYLESLSWLSASEVLKVFDGVISWSRISEVDGPEGLGSLEIRRLAEAGDVRLRLRVRRATMRLVASHVYEPTRDMDKVSLVLFQLPFEAEYLGQGVEVPKLAASDLIYRFELGRASQIPGLEGEAERLSALAGVVMWHQAMTFEDSRTGKKTDVRAIDANLYMHALKRTHRLMYSQHFGAKEYAKNGKPHDVVLTVSLKSFLAKTLPTLGLTPKSLVEIAKSADENAQQRLDLDWIRGEQVMTRHHPITVRMAKGADHIMSYVFPETSTVDAFDLAKHGKIQADYFVSGMDLWSATNPQYVPALLGALVKIFKAVKGDAVLALVVGLPPSGDKSLVGQLRQQGLKPEPMDPNNLDYYNGPYVLKITVEQLLELAKTDPLIEKESRLTEVNIRTWQAIRDLSLLPGL